MHEYAIKTSSERGWTDSQGCELGISLGNFNQEGDKFRSTIRWADKRFARCIITLSDTLYRYSLMCDGASEAAAYFQTRAKGDLWLERNHDALNAAERTEIIVQRWDEWLSHPAYKALHRELIAFRDEDSGLRTAFETDALNYISRRYNRHEAFDFERALHNSMAYLAEEIACYILIGRTYGALRVYPGEDMHCFHYMRTGAVPESLRGLEKAPHLKLGFRRKLNASPVGNRQAAA